MRILPVVDLLEGRAVHAVGGERQRYAPAQSWLVHDGDVEELAESLLREFHCGELYVADLDAIQHRGSSQSCLPAFWQRDMTVWLDAGIEALDRFNFAQQISIVGLESVPCPEDLITLKQRCASRRAAFSLDLRNGSLLAADTWSHLAPIDVVAQAVDAGFERFVILDLAAVGRAAGPNVVKLCEAVRRRFPELEIVSGGGVRNLEDLRALEQAGCNAVLVATALHRGMITPRDVHSYNQP